jgi:hypothetical protein
MPEMPNSIPILGTELASENPDAHLLRFDDRYPVFLQTRHPHPVPEIGEKIVSLVWLAGNGLVNGNLLQRDLYEQIRPDRRTRKRSKSSY